MNGWVVAGILAALVLVVVVILARRGAKQRARRAAYAHSEPGGPHVQHHDGASGLAAARLAEGAREWGDP